MSVAPTREETIYAAGLFDGEGCVMIVDYRARGSRCIKLRASITNTNFPVLLWLKERWGGSIIGLRSVRVQQEHPEWKACSQWQLSARAAAIFLVAIEPFVIVKRAQVENAIAFQATKRQDRKKLTDAEWQSALRFLARQHDLNARGLP